MKILSTYKYTKCKSILLYCFFCMCFPVIVNGQNDSVSTMQLNYVKQKITGTWIYQKTIIHGLQVENPIDSNRVYFINEKNAIIATNLDGKFQKRKYNYSIRIDGKFYFINFYGKKSKDNCFLLIESISDTSMIFISTQNDHYHVTATKIINNNHSKLSRRKRKKLDEQQMKLRYKGGFYNYKKN